MLPYFTETIRVEAVCFIAGLVYYSSVTGSIVEKAGSRSAAIGSVKDSGCSECLYFSN
jgi:hypothetical protein